MTSFSMVRQQARDLVEQLPDATLVEAVMLLKKLRSQSYLDPGNVESELLQVIDWKLSDEDESRLSYLRKRNEAGVITVTEHQELLDYVERLEQLDAQRAEALIQLADLRQVGLESVLQEFLPAYGS